MLISRVPDDGAGEARGTADTQDALDHSDEYQTANELFEFMAKNHTFDINDSPLSTSDLVILYKNIELGTTLLTTTNETKRPNQHVETVVYNDDADSDSDLSDFYTSENMQDVFQINKERIDLLNAPLSRENNLCNKLGNLKLQTHSFSNDYDKHFLFKDPYIKKQLTSFNSKEFENTMLPSPSSLLDYICCKRLEDNYNFYMENVIRYVKNTIEQLTRISNGDYLTEKAKQKWQEVQGYTDIESNKQILATSTSIPLHVERKVLPGRTSMWDDLVHSEVDIRSLSKILEKRIFLEVPKIISGSYRLLRKRCADNLVISCKRVSSCEDKDDKKKSRIDVVLKLKKSDSGHVVSNINSIMILQTTPYNLRESNFSGILPLPTLETEEDLDNKINNIKIVELDEQKCDDTESSSPNENHCCVLDTDIKSHSNLATNAFTHSKFEHAHSVPEKNCNNEYVISSTHKNILNSKLPDDLFQNSTTFNDVIPPDELRFSMCNLDIQTSLPEESIEDLQCKVNKKKSPSRVRIKSPYENKSYVIEEKKRKKLLEIRERREKRKMALSESCRIVKHKYGANRTMMPQSSSSVTKLSISNKSFYNSIYGHNDDQQQKVKKGKKESVLEISEGFSEENNVLLSTPDVNNKKYINRSFYLDDTVTEVMRMQMTKGTMDKQLYSASTSSAVSSGVVPEDCSLGQGNSMFSQLIKRTDVESEDNSILINSDANEELERPLLNIYNGEDCSKDFSDSHGVVPVNTPKEMEVGGRDLRNEASAVQCRKSIDKIYDLMKKPVKIDTSGKNSLKIKCNNFESIDDTPTYQESSAGQASDSGTSLKHRTLSGDSEFSFQNTNNANSVETKYVTIESKEKPLSVVPKVIISTKPSAQKTDTEKYKKDRKKVTINTPKTADNPLKAISHLLHEFENVQKLRHKGPNVKSKNKVETVITDGQNSCRQRSYVKNSRFDQQITNHEHITVNKNNLATAKDENPLSPTDITKIPYQQVPSPKKSNDKHSKKKISDIIDEAKEARGEAVRGPSKTSRLNTLAQPKKSYVQAHSEEFQNKYGRNLMTDRLQRLAGTPQPPQALEKNVVFRNWRKPRRTGPEIISSMSVKHTPRAMSPLEKGRQRNSNSSSPECCKRPAESSCKPNYVGDAPEILKNKMVAVESYVKLHYGRAPPPAVAPAVEPEVAHMSRVPLLPTDLELLSLTSSPAEASTALGNKLHNLIDTMFGSISPVLDTLSECPETSSKLSNADDSIGKPFSKDDKSASLDSEEHVDVFDDRNICTAIEHLGKEDDNSHEINFENVESKCNIGSFNSRTEMHRLENALQRKVSIGSFQKRLRIKKLTLTPKQSMQEVVILQSGDAHSLIRKTSLTQNFVPCSKNMHDINDFPLLTKPYLNWNFAEIPMHISTVGYTFPTYQNVQNVAGESVNSTLCKKLHAIEENNSLNYCKSSSKCLKSIPINLNVKNMDLIKACNSLDHPKKSYKNPTSISEKININNLEPVNIKTEPSCVDHNRTSANTNVDNSDHTVNDKSDDIEYTNSLDMLVTLLNEIQKITTCQTLTKSDGGDVHCEQSETMLNNTATIETVMNHTRKLKSIASLDKLRQLDSNPSIYALYLHNGRECETRENETCTTPKTSDAETTRAVKKIYTDKEISVDITDKLYTNMFTDVPSRLFTDSINHSTNITNSLITVFKKPGTQSVTSYKDYHYAYSNASINSQKKIIAVTYAGNPEIKKSFNSFEIHEKFNIDNHKSDTSLTLKMMDNIEMTPDEICIPKLKKVSKYFSAENKTDNTLEIYQKCSDDNDKVIAILPSAVTDNIELKPKDIIIPNLMTNVSKPKHYVVGEENDPAMRIKRDILVTLYSVLVFTVFAALSFPELVYHV